MPGQATNLEPFSEHGELCQFGQKDILFLGLGCFVNLRLSRLPQDNAKSKGGRNEGHVWAQLDLFIFVLQFTVQLSTFPKPQSQQVFGFRV